MKHPHGVVELSVQPEDDYDPRQPLQRQRYNCCNYYII